jgi:hypothetical protein
MKPHKGQNRAVAKATQIIASYIVVGHYMTRATAEACYASFRGKPQQFLMHLPKRKKAIISNSELQIIPRLCKFVHKEFIKSRIFFGSLG